MLASALAVSGLRDDAGHGHVVHRSACVAWVHCQNGGSAFGFMGRELVLLCSACFLRRAMRRCSLAWKPGVGRIVLEPAKLAAQVWASLEKLDTLPYVGPDALHVVY